MQAIGKQFILWFGGGGSLSDSTLLQYCPLEQFMRSILLGSFYSSYTNVRPHNGRVSIYSLEQE